jgi:hypothetical protein
MTAPGGTASSIPPSDRRLKTQFKEWNELLRQAVNADPWQETPHLPMSFTNSTKVAENRTGRMHQNRHESGFFTRLRLGKLLE